MIRIPRFNLSGLLSIVALAMLAIVSGCSNAEAPAARMTLNLVPYNHMTDGIANFDVQIKGGSKSGGGFLDAGSGGGSMICCVSIPEKWQPGLTAKVTAEVYRNSGEKYDIAKEVPIPEYTREQAGHLSVHFLRDGEVKIFVTRYALWHPDYPLKGREAELKPAAR
ncbi:DUF3304 domain-containing protein [Herbaspirillum seropedicae]|uniref:DUF3304 domain-containing protein n=1 Tax=Herbaspirillum seropedicae TaxID=964 RepID=UPI000863AF92|nr:DUF3304 domain-containing protein [Herbaspirillum seropedicae]AON53074.1 hypothetical protein Hsc_0768 [Herbaspirillum seropedicae]